MSDGGIVTAEVGGWTVTSNSAGSEAKLRDNLKPKVDAGVSQAAKELGKRGGEAAAKARAEQPEPEPEAKPEVKAKPIPDAAPAADKAPDKPEGEAEPKPQETKAEGEDIEQAKAEAREKAKDPYRRMLEATRKEAEAKTLLAQERRAREALEARLATLEAGRTAPKADAEPPVPKREGKPTPADFESYEDYLDARDTYNWNMRQAEAQRQAQMSAVDRALGDQITKFREAAAANLEKYSEEVLSLRAEFQLAEGEQPDGSNWLANELIFNDLAPSLMEYLSQHPDDHRRIAALRNPRAVSREVAKIEARLEAATSGNGTKREDVSRAAPPVKPVTGKPYVSDGEEWRPGMSLDDYARIWRKQNARR